MFVSAEIAGKSTGSVFVLPRSVVRAGDRVMVVDNDNRLYFRDVDVLRAETGPRAGPLGTQPGERIVVSTLEAAVNGMQVQVVAGEQSAPSDQAGGSAAGLSPEAAALAAAGSFRARLSDAIAVSISLSNRGRRQTSTETS